MNGCRHRPAWLIAALLWLALLPAFAGSRLLDIERELRARPDDALKALAALPAATGVERIETLVLRGWLQARLSDAAAVEQTAAELESLSTAKAPEPLATAAASLLRARAIWRRGPLGRADRLLGDALSQLPPDAPQGLRLRIVETRAVVRQRLGKLDEAIALHQEAIGLADALGIDWLRADQRSQMSYTLYLAQQVERSAEINREARALAARAADLLLLSSGATMESFFAEAQGRSEDELQALRDALRYAQEAGARREQVLSTANLADYYLKHGDYATALAVARKAVPLAREIKDATIESLALTNAGLALIALGRHAEGLPMVQEALQIEERAGALNEMSRLQEELGLTLEKAGLLKEAWKALVEHRRLAGELFRREHQQAVLELQEGFEAEQRQRELALLGTESRLKEEQLLSRDLQQKLWALGIASGALVLAAVVALLRRARRSNAQLESTNLQLQVAAEVDPLTGLANRRHFLAAMDKIAGGGAFEGSLLLVDVDHFKRINDEHGHATGDAVLVELARRLRLAMRPEDLTVRWGGEEFLIVVQALPQDQVETMAERLLAVIGREPVIHGRQSVSVTASIGFATFPLEPARHPLPWERAIDLVDTALYLAKAHGRNRAYGVRSLQSDEEGTAAAAGSLETAWRSGRADLKAVNGPAPLEVLP